MCTERGKGAEKGGRADDKQVKPVNKISADLDFFKGNMVTLESDWGNLL